MYLKDHLTGSVNMMLQITNILLQQSEKLQFYQEPELWLIASKVIGAIVTTSSLLFCFVVKKQEIH